MIRVRFLQNTVLFVDRRVQNPTSGQTQQTQRQWHITSGDIHAVDAVNAISDRQYQFVLPGNSEVSEVVNGVDVDIVEIMRDIPQAKSPEPGCGGCG